MRGCNFAKIAGVQQHLGCKPVTCPASFGAYCGAAFRNVYHFESMLRVEAGMSINAAVSTCGWEVA